MVSESLLPAAPRRAFASMADPETTDLNWRQADMGVTWEIPKIRGSLCWDPVIRILLFRVLYSVPYFWKPPHTAYMYEMLLLRSFLARVAL